MLHMRANVRQQIIVISSNFLQMCEHHYRKSSVCQEKPNYFCHKEAFFFLNLITDSQSDGISVPLIYNFVILPWAILRKITGSSRTKKSNLTLLSDADFSPTVDIHNFEVVDDFSL
ncbi:unnamed protein product [Ceratitis capitata]|uniref:(Mediterranean fruit fly) hypothetical protein n=1 Tax=Ceratitis capitata TaxID=7213 RepID=A0A811UGX6_CERCA|nr:unnamed protein product [Ceratitis capitata]